MDKTHNQIESPYIYEKTQRDTGSIQGSNLSTELTKDTKTLDTSNWRPQDWENYLVSTETYQREDSLGDGRKIESLSEKDYAAALVDIFHQKKYPRLVKKVGAILDTLTPRQKEIVRLRYWDNKTLNEIAEIFHISYQSVQESLKGAHKHIGLQLKKVSAKKIIKNNL